MTERTCTSPRPVTPTTIVAAELTSLCRELDGARGVDDDILRRLRRARDTAVGLDPYLELCTTPESGSLAELARRTRETDWDTFGSVEQEMLTGHLEGRFLQFLIRMCGCVRVLDIGMFTGYSALAMAEALPADGSVVTCELDPEVARFAQRSFDRTDAGARIDVQVGPAAATLQRLDEQCRLGERAPFDFAFVDADKAGYSEYLDILLGSHLLTADALIAVDNTLLQGEPYLPGSRSVNGCAVAEFNAAVRADERVEQVLVPIRDGLTLIRRVDRRGDESGGAAP